MSLVHKLRKKHPPRKEKPAIESEHPHNEGPRTESDGDTAELVRQTTRLAGFTKGLVIATIALGVVSAFIAGVGIWQGTITRDAITAQDSANSKQIARMDSQLTLSRRADTVQRAFDTAQINRMDTQVGVSREAMQRQLRAYLAIGNIGLPVLNEDGSIFLDTMQVFNQGETPATKVEVYQSCDVGPASGFGFEKPPTKIIGFPTVAKNTSGLEYLVTNTGPFGISQRPFKIKSGINALYRWGRIDYIDIFGRIQHFPYRFKSTWDASSNRMGPFEETRKGND